MARDRYIPGDLCQDSNVDCLYDRFGMLCGFYLSELRRSDARCLHVGDLGKSWYLKLLDDILESINSEVDARIYIGGRLKAWSRCLVCTHLGGATDKVMVRHEREAWRGRWKPRDDEKERTCKEGVVSRYRAMEEEATGEGEGAFDQILNDIEGGSSESCSNNVGDVEEGTSQPGYTKMERAPPTGETTEDGVQSAGRHDSAEQTQNIEVQKA